LHALTGALARGEVSTVEVVTEQVRKLRVTTTSRCASREPSSDQPDGIGQDETMTWIADMTTRIADATGIPEASLTVDGDDGDLLLRLAGIAAHESGDRTNAPILCHVLGRAVALGAPLDELANVVEGAA
jgi:hypothetical protein